MKQIKLVERVFTPDGDDWPPEDDAADFISWFQQRLDGIPMRHRDDVRIELVSCARIAISYARMETDREEAEREREEDAQAQRLRAAPHEPPTR